VVMASCSSSPVLSFKQHSDGTHSLLIFAGFIPMKPNTRRPLSSMDSISLPADLLLEARIMRIVRNEHTKLLPVDFEV
jgi:hypothetical protein